MPYLNFENRVERRQAIEEFRKGVFMKSAIKRFLSVFLVLAMLMSISGIAAFADGEADGSSGVPAYEDQSEGGAPEADPEPDPATEPEPDPVPDPVQELSIELSRGSITIGSGGTAALMCSASGGSGSYRYYWTSTNTGIVDVVGFDSTADIEAMSAGTATVSVRVSDGETSATASCEVVVEDPGRSVTYDCSFTTTADKAIGFDQIIEKIAASYQTQIGTSIDYSATAQFGTTSINVGSIQYQNGTILTPGNKYQFSSLYATAFFQPYSSGSFVTRYTVTDGNNVISGNISITVNGSVTKVTGVTLSPTSLNMDTYSSRALSVSVTPLSANFSVSWSSSNTNVITISGTGTGVAISSKSRTGNATITVTVTDNNTGDSYQRTCNVKVKDDDDDDYRPSRSSAYNPGITLTYGSDYYGTSISDSLANEFYNRFGVSLPNGATLRFSSLTTTYGRLIQQNGSYARTSTTYSFSDLKQMSFEPYKAGTWTADYSLSYGGNSLAGTIYVYVKGSSLSVSISTSKVTLAPYSSQYLYVTVSPNSYYRVDWKSSNTGVATVAGNGAAATVNTYGKAGTATITATATDASGIQTQKSCTVTVTNSNTLYSPSMATYIGNTTKGTTIYDSLKSQFRNVHGVTPSDSATIRFSSTGDSKVAVRKLSNGRAISANTNYTLGDYKGMYTDPVAAGAFSVPYTLTYNGNTLSGNITVNVNPAPVNVSLALPNSSPYTFSTMLSSGTASGQLVGGINGALNSATSASWSYIRFSSPSLAAGTLYLNSSRSTLYNSTNITPAMFDQLYFVPAQPGTFESGFTAYNSAGNTVAMGKFSIIVPGTSPANNAGLKVQMTNQTVTINGRKVDTEVYNINGANFFKLRDIAAMLNGTGSQFSVGYDNITRAITVNTGASYNAIGTELVKGPDQSAKCVLNNMMVYINGYAVNLLAYNIGGSTFFQLRELGNSLGFGVGYDDATRTVLITSR